MSKVEDDTPKRFGLKESTITKIIGVLSQHPEVESAILYGSRAKGNYRNGSDIDLTLIGQNLTFETLLLIENEIDDLLLPYLFDISRFSRIANPDLIEHINRVGNKFYERSSSNQTDTTLKVTA